MFAGDGDVLQLGYRQAALRERRSVHIRQRLVKYAIALEAPAACQVEERRLVAVASREHERSRGRLARASAEDRREALDRGRPAVPPQLHAVVVAEVEETHEPPARPGDEPVLVRADLDVGHGARLGEHAKREGLARRPEVQRVDCAPLSGIGDNRG